MMVYTFVLYRAMVVVVVMVVEGGCRETAVHATYCFGTVFIFSSWHMIK